MGSNLCGKHGDDVTSMACNRHAIAQTQLRKRGTHEIRFPHRFELGEGWVRLAMWLTSASPGGFHDWKTLYQDRHRFYMWLHTYIVEANLVYCSPTVPLLEIKDNAADIYKKRQ
jgi:hypothetical protein